METAKFLTIGLILCVFLMPRESNAQVFVNEKVEVYYRNFLPCANDGLGEWASGTLTLHFVIGKNKWQNQIAGGELIGEETGTIYHPSGIGQQIHATELSTLPNTTFMVLHIVGDGFVFKEQWLFIWVFINGEWVSKVSRIDTSCK